MPPAAFSPEHPDSSPGFEAAGRALRGSEVPQLCPPRRRLALGLGSVRERLASAAKPRALVLGRLRGSLHPQCLRGWGRQEGPGDRRRLAGLEAGRGALPREDGEMPLHLGDGGQG